MDQRFQRIHVVLPVRLLAEPVEQGFLVGKPVFLAAEGFVGVDHAQDAGAAGSPRRAERLGIVRIHGRPNRRGGGHQQVLDRVRERYIGQEIEGRLERIRQLRGRQAARCRGRILRFEQAEIVEISREGQRIEIAPAQAESLADHPAVLGGVMGMAAHAEVGAFEQ